MRVEILAQRQARFHTTSWCRVPGEIDTTCSPSPSSCRRRSSGRATRSGYVPAAPSGSPSEALEEPTHHQAKARDDVRLGEEIERAEGNRVCSGTIPRHAALARPHDPHRPGAGREIVPYLSMTSRSFWSGDLTSIARSGGPCQ